MAEQDHELTVGLPKELQRQFDEVERRLWRVESGFALALIGVGWAGAVLGLFFLDRFFETPMVLRVLAALIGWGIFVIAIVRWLRLWVFRRRDLEALARLVQKSHRRLGDRLLGIVELSHERRHTVDFSPTLYRAAIQQVADDARNCDFRASVDSNPAKRLGLAAGVLCAGGIGLFLVFPQAMSNALARLMLPGAPIARFTLVRLTGVSNPMVVAHGEPFMLRGELNYRSFWHPEQVSLSIRGQNLLSGKVVGGKFTIPVPGQLERETVELTVGDARLPVEIIPTYRPSLKELGARIQLPAYLEYPEQTETVRNGSLLAVEGSRVAFQGKISRPITLAQAQLDSNPPVSLRVKQDSFESEFANTTGLSRFSVNWEDAFGLTNAVPLEVNVQTQKDSPPTPDIPDIPRNVVMLNSDVLSVRIEARDDYGVRDLGLMWEIYADVPVAGGTASTEVKMLAETPHERRMEKTFSWSPVLFRVPADSVVDLQAFARDYYPKRERVKSPIYRVQVMSPEKHAEMLRLRLEGILSKVEEVARFEEKIANNTLDIKDNIDLPENQKLAKLAQNQEDQLQNAANLEQVSREGKQVLQEAMKNPSISTDAMREFGQAVNQWQKLAQKNMRGAADDLKSSRQNASSRQQDLESAYKKEKEAVDALAKQQGKNNESMDELQAMTMAQRLHHLAERQGESSQRLQTVGIEAIGLLPQEVPAKVKELEQGLATGQDNIRSDSDTLQAEISRFFERTKKTNYNQVAMEMKAARIPEEMEALSARILENVAMDSALAMTNWAQRFNQWGDTLEPKTDKNSGGDKSSKASGKKQADLTKQLVALLRLKQQQMTVREQTRVLEGHKDSNYGETAQNLANRESGLASDLVKIQKEIDQSSFDSTFEEASAAMTAVKSLLQKPQTDKVTDGSEGKAVDLLSDLVNLINEQAQRASPSQGQASDPQESQAEEMAFLTQMMKEANENQPDSPQATHTQARMTSGGKGSAALPVRGDVRGKAAGSRTVGKAAGVLENSPAEYREALENYFHAIEKKNP